MASLQLRRRPALSPRRPARRTRRTRPPDQDASLLDIVDHVLTKGVVVSGDVVLALADVDLVYLRLSALLCAADRLTPRKRRT
jgi:Gas vesicle protein